MVQTRSRRADAPLETGLPTPRRKPRKATNDTAASASAAEDGPAQAAAAPKAKVPAAKKTKVTKKSTAKKPKTTRKAPAKKTATGGKRSAAATNQTTAANEEQQPANTNEDGGDHDNNAATASSTTAAAGALQPSQSGAVGLGIMDSSTNLPEDVDTADNKASTANIQAPTARVLSSQITQNQQPSSAAPPNERPVAEPLTPKLGGASEAEPSQQSPQAAGSQAVRKRPSDEHVAQPESPSKKRKPSDEAQSPAQKGLDRPTGNDHEGKTEVVPSQSTTRPSSPSPEEDRARRIKVSREYWAGWEERRAEGERDNPCATFEKQFEERKWQNDVAAYLDTQANRTSPFDDPFAHGKGQPIEDEAVFRAIAAVTEAVPGHRFSLIDPVSFALATATDLQVPHNAFNRMKEVIVPYTKGGHHSLFVFPPSEQAPSAGGITRPSFDAYHYESSNRMLNKSDYGTTSRNHYRDICNRLVRLQWTSDNTVFGELESRLHTIPQAEKWTCGIHVILNAWAYALGLKMEGQEGKPARALPRYEAFIDKAMTIIRLALQGHMDSYTIQNFLRCHGFVEILSIAPQERRFRQTERFATEDSLPQYIGDMIAADRLKKDLAGLYGDNVSLRDILRWARLINATGPFMDIRNVGADHFHQRLGQYQAFMKTPGGPFKVPTDVQDMAAPEDESTSAVQNETAAASAEPRTSLNAQPQPGTNMPPIPDFEFTPTPSPTMPHSALNTATEQQPVGSTEQTATANAAQEQTSTTVLGLEEAVPTPGAAADEELEALLEAEFDMFSPVDNRNDVESTDGEESERDIREDCQDADDVQQPDDLSDVEDESDHEDTQRQTKQPPPPQEPQIFKRPGLKKPDLSQPPTPVDQLTDADKDAIDEAAPPPPRRRGGFASLLASIGPTIRYNPHYKPLPAGVPPPAVPNRFMYSPETTPMVSHSIRAEAEKFKFDIPASETTNAQPSPESAGDAAAADGGIQGMTDGASETRTPGHEQEDEKEEQEKPGPEYDEEKEEEWWSQY